MTEETTIEDPKWTNIQVDSQILSTFMSCARKADYVFNQQLVAIGGTSKAFEKGQLGHIGIHAYWVARIAGEDFMSASTIGLEKAKQSALEFKNLEAEDCLDCFQTLVQFFKFISNSAWIPLAVEKHFRFVAYENEAERLRIILTGRIDLIVKTPQIPIIPIDNKTESERWFYSQMSNQFKIYCLACKSNVLGVQRVGYTKLKPEDKFRLELLPFDPDILEEFRTEILPYWCKQLLLCKEENYWPPNTASCVHGHFKCQFSDAYNGGICNISRSVRQQKLERYFTKGPNWDPANF